MKKVEITTIFYDYSLNDPALLSNDKYLITKAREAALMAYSPYSKFSVGAAVLLTDGQIVMGNNQENAAYPSGLCAERVALFYANANFPTTAVQSIAVTAYYNGKYISQPVPPCGGCRQVLLETEHRFKNPIRILLAGEDNVQILDSARSLLPLTFDEDFLRNK